jgi:peptidoglycan biosynthesis protein MviN/MurJ (putative lipid II flippase)
MDKTLLVVATAAFILGLGLGIGPAWTAGATLVAVLLYLGLRYPRGRADWKYPPIESIYMVSTLVTMLVFVYVIYVSAAVLDLPWDSGLAMGVAALAFLVMLLLGMFYPAGGKIPVRSRK